MNVTHRKVVERIDRWDIEQREDGSHFAITGEGTKWQETLVVEKGMLCADRERSGKHFILPLSVVKRLIELEEARPS